MSYFIGLLSGTSVDAIDAAIVQINSDEIKLVCTHEQKFSTSLKNSLQNIIKTQQVSLKSLSETDSLLAFEFSQAVEVLLNKSDLDKTDISAIGSHGQTIYHQPNGNHANTMQIGCAHKLAANTGIDVVTNFRYLDMAFGGQGAPLAPLLHQKLFVSKNKNTAVINLGGIANISFVGKGFASVIGFDTGPANCLIDQWITIHKQKPFDKDGKWAQLGVLNKTLLSQMLDDEYFNKPFPKSTGREYFNLNWYDNFIDEFKTTSAIDIQSTLTHLTAKSIAQTIEHVGASIDEIIVMGGGAKNSFLLELLKNYTNTTIQIADDSDWVEAILFAYLAERRVNKHKLDLSSFTGSTKEILVGDIIEV